MGSVDRPRLVELCHVSLHLLIRSIWMPTDLHMSLYCRCLSSSMLAPALSSLVSDLDTHNSALTSLSLSIYVVGFALGPLITAPLSEMYGRIIVYHISSLLFLAFTSASAASSNIGMFIAFRFFSGCVGITPAALLGGSIGDLMPPSSMGKATGGIAIGSLIAPVSGIIDKQNTQADKFCSLSPP